VYRPQPPDLDQLQFDAEYHRDTIFTFDGASSERRSLTLLAPAPGAESHCGVCSVGIAPTRATAASRLTTDQATTP
jgi:hypothetical protein